MKRNFERATTTAGGLVILHVTGTAVMAVLLSFLSLNPSIAADVAAQLLAVEEIRADVTAGALKHLALSVVAWTVVYVMFAVVRRRLEQRPVRRTVAQRGSVMIETLIVLPVFLLLVFGLMQMSVNNIASVMTSYAGFAGARSVWVWDGENVAGRRGVDEAELLERARISVAMAMAPVATGEFFNDESATSDELKLARKAMYTRFNFLLGDAGILAATANLDLNRQAYRSNKSFWRAIDSESFGNRAVRKLTRAYLATDVGSGTVSATDQPGLLMANGEIGLRFTYQHHQTMPVVSALFGERGMSGGRGGYFNELSKEYSFPRQRHQPSANWPSN